VLSVGGVEDDALDKGGFKVEEGGREQ